jgi:hypothetical protein
MTLAVAFKGPEGLVLAADSRITITATVSAGEQKQQYISYFDNATKLFEINGQPHIGVLTYGNTIIGTSSVRTVHGFMPEFEAKLSSGETSRAAVLRDLALLCAAVLKLQKLKGYGLSPRRPGGRSSREEVRP